MSRPILHRTHGHGRGPITRLMSPSDLGEVLKPFVFLDRFQVSMRARGGSGGMPLHPHSGIATVTVFTDGDATFDDPAAGRGTLAYGGVEWARAGRGIWHGQELAAGTSPTTQGFQLWLALPPELETAEAESQYVEAEHIPVVGPARLVIGRYDGAESPVRAPAGINYLMSKLGPGERWTYAPPKGHQALWVALANGALCGAAPVEAGALAVFEPGEAPVTFEASGEGATFVLGSAVPHRHPLHLGRYSVHTSPEALAVGERHIVELRRLLDGAASRQTPSGSTPVFRG